MRLASVYHRNDSLNKRPTRLYVEAATRESQSSFEPIPPLRDHYA